MRRARLVGMRLARWFSVSFACAALVLAAATARAQDAGGVVTGPLEPSSNTPTEGDEDDPCEPPDDLDEDADAPTYGTPLRRLSERYVARPLVLPENVIVPFAGAEVRRRAPNDPNYYFPNVGVRAGMPFLTGLELGATVLPLEVAMDPLTRRYGVGYGNPSIDVNYRLVPLPSLPPDGVSREPFELALRGLVSLPVSDGSTATLFFGVPMLVRTGDFGRLDLTPTLSYSFAPRALFRFDVAYSVQILDFFYMGVRTGFSGFTDQLDLGVVPLGLTAGIATVSAFGVDWEVVLDGGFTGLFAPGSTGRQVDTESFYVAGSFRWYTYWCAP